MQFSGLLWSVRRRRALAVLRLKARAKRARVDVRVDPSARISPRARIAVGHGTRSVLEIGPGCELHEGVLVQLRGGALRMGTDSALRRGTIVSVSGALTMEGRNVLSYHCVVHCHDRITLRRQASASEFVTIADSRHFPDGPAEWFYDNVESAPIEIGENTWLAPKSTVTMGTTIGRDVVVAAGAVVVDDLPDGAVAAGVPARVLRRR
jgi:acetyltransferase-like isoleucine patch superfamily enzyme